MAVIGDLDEAALASMTNRVIARLSDGSISMSPPAPTTIAEISGASVMFVLDTAPGTPESLAREAAIRLAGWLADNRPAIMRHVVKDPSGTDIELAFANHAASANGARNSGCLAMIAPYIVRRAGLVG